MKLCWVLALTATTPNKVSASENDCQPGYTGYTLKLGTSCGQYVQCVNGIVVETISCPSGTLFNGDVNKGGVCDWADLVECKDISTAEATLPATLATSITLTDESSAVSNATTVFSNNSYNYYCGSTYQEASELCNACPSGSLSECTNPTHGCFIGVQCVTSSSTTYVNGKRATQLASRLKIMIEMDKNFDHNVNCSLGDWGLCYTKTVVIDYLGTEDYLDK